MGLIRASEKLALSRSLKSSKVSHPWALACRSRSETVFRDTMMRGCHLSLAKAAVNGPYNSEVVVIFIPPVR